MGIDYLLFEHVLGIRVGCDLNGILDLRLHLLSLAGGAGQPARQTHVDVRERTQKGGGIEIKAPARNTSS
jgi:hypothetical protein